MFEKQSLKSFLGISFIVILLLFIARYFFIQSGSQKVTIQSAPRGGDFRVYTEEGEVSLSSYQGRVILLYFGFTSCPKVCPLMLTKISKAIQALKKDQQEQVRVLFISVDPERDSKEILSKYVQKYGSQFVGSTSDPESLQAIVRLYGGYFAKMPLEASGQYTMDHTTQAFLVDKFGKFIKPLPETLDFVSIKQEIEVLLNTEK